MEFRELNLNENLQKGIAKADVLGVGVGVPGPVKSDGTVLQCVNLGWGVFNVSEKLGGAWTEY